MTRLANRTPYAPARASAPLLVACLTVAMIAGTSVRTAFSPVQEIARIDLRLTDFQISLVQGLAVSLPIALLSVPLGRLVDRHNRLRVLIGLLLLSAGGAALTGVAHSFAALFVARMLAGISAVLAFPVCVSLVADTAAADRRGRSLLFLQVGLTAGGALAFVLVGTLLTILKPLTLPGIGTLLAWQQIQFVFAAIGVMAALPLLAVSEPDRHEVEAGTGLLLGDALAALWERRGFLIPLYVGEITIVMADIAASIWAAPVLTRKYGLTPDKFGGWISLVFLLSGIIGATIGGLVSDLGLKQRIPGGVLGGAIAASACGIPAAFFAVAPSVTSFGLLLALLLAAGSVTTIVISTVIAVYIPNELRGLAMGVFIVFSSIVAVGLAPSLVPFADSIFGGERYLGLSLALVTAATSVIGLIGFVISAQRLPVSDQLIPSRGGAAPR